MKRKIVQALLLFATMISLSTSYCVVPLQGQDKINETDVAAQTKSTDIHGSNLQAGISRELYLILSNETNNCVITGTNVTKSKDNMWTEGWVTTTVNIRKEPSIDSEILGTLSFNDYVNFYQFNEEWDCITFQDNEIAYVYIDYISNKINGYVDYSVPKTNGFKSFMSYEAITSKGSLQYKLQEYYAYTGTYGIRQVNDRYCVAIGTAFDIKIGTYFDLILENGTIIPCILGDVKDEIHTDKSNIITVANGCVSEFIVDLQYLNENAKRDGDISFCYEEWDSPVSIIRIYDKNIFE